MPQLTRRRRAAATPIEAACGSSSYDPCRNWNTAIRHSIDSDTTTTIRKRRTHVGALIVYRALRLFFQHRLPKFEQQLEACLHRFGVGRVHGGPDFDGSHSDKRTAANEESTNDQHIDIKKSFWMIFPVSF
jgi:hypothetical protein